MYTTEYYSAMKRNEVMSFAGKWTALEIIMVTEKSQVQKVKWHELLLIGRI
jgi:hypothetical protein